MNFNRPTRGVFVDKLKRYGWFLGLIVTVVLIVLIVFKKPEGLNIAPQEISLPNQVSLPGPVASVSKEDQNEPNNVKNVILDEHYELPVPEDVQAVARYYSSDGPPNIRDAEVLWQKTQNKYINFLSSEEFQQSLYRTSIWSELILVLGGGGNFFSRHPEIISTFAKTRRFSKLVSQITEAKQRGDVEIAVRTIEATIKRFTEERQELEHWFDDAIRKGPEFFNPQDPDKQNEIADRTMGCGSTGLETSEDMIPPSLQGVQLGISANCFLLGLTQSPRTIKTLLDVGLYDEELFISKFTEFSKSLGQFPGGKQDIKYLYGFANPTILADAIDRVLVGASQNPTVGGEALVIAKDYEQWRKSRNLPEREVVKVYAYDSARTPHHLPGSVGGVSKKAETTSLELPLQFVEHGIVMGIDKDPDVIQIMDWAKRFTEALEK